MEQRRGFSIIEVLVYVAILATASVLIVSSIVQLTQLYGKGRAERRLVLAAENAFERITRELRLAQSIDTASPYTLPGSRIKLNTFQSYTDFTPTTRTIDLDSGYAVLDNNLAKILTPIGVAVTNLTFTQLTGGASDAVRVQMTLTTSGGPFQPTRTFFTTVVLRGSYLDI